MCHRLSLRFHPDLQAFHRLGERGRGREQVTHRLRGHFRKACRIRAAADEVGQAARRQIGRKRIRVPIDLAVARAASLAAFDTALT